MKQIKIDETLKAKCPDFCLAVMTFDVEVNASCESLKAEIAQLEMDVMAQLSLDNLLKQPRILAARQGYKTLGKDPSRYRLATESLLRRLIKGNGLYFVNNAVDLGNILSAQTQRSVAVLDGDQVKGDVLIRIAGDEPYEGIGRGAINIENIPVYCDEVGPFGSPTSDTLRTAITDHTKKVLLFIISFDGVQGLIEDAQKAEQLYTKYANGVNFSMEIVE